MKTVLEGSTKTLDSTNKTTPESFSKLSTPPAAVQALNNLEVGYQTQNRTPGPFNVSSSNYEHLTHAKTAFEEISKHNIFQKEDGNLNEMFSHVHLNEANLPEEDQVRAVQAVHSHQEDLLGNITLFEAWMTQKGLVATAVSGDGLNCLINALIQHATGNYLHPNFEQASIIRAQINNEFPNLPVMMHDDDPRTQRAVEIVNATYGTHLDIYFIQANHEGLPAIVSTSREETVNAAEQHPAVIWQQGAHYVSITTLHLYTAKRVEATAIAATNVFMSTSKQSLEVAADISPQKDSRIDQHYQAVQEYARKRTWKEEALLLEIPSNKQQRVEHFLKLLQDQSFELTPFIAVLEKVEGDELKLRLQLKHRYEDPRVSMWVLVALEILIKKKDSEAAEAILNQLHGLEVEDYLLQEAEKLESQHKLREAASYYQALTLMHPFDIHAYIKRAEMFSNMNEYVESSLICKEALKKIVDPLEREILEYKIVLNVISRNKPINFRQSDARKFLETCFKILEKFMTPELGREGKSVFIKLLSQMLKDYAYHFGFKDTASFRWLFSYTQKLLRLVDVKNPEMQEMRQYWAGQMMQLLYLCDIIEEDSVHSKANYLRSMAIQFHEYSRVVQFYFNWCFKNQQTNSFISFYEDQKLFSSALYHEYYYLAKAIEATQASAPLEEIERYLVQSHRSARLPWTAFNLGSFLLTLKKPPEPQAALAYFEEAIKEEKEPNLNHMLGLWACQLLCAKTKEATSTLNGLSLLSSDKLQACYKLQKRVTYSYEEVLYCAGFKQELELTYTPAATKPAQAPPLTPFGKWIDERKIDIGEGYIGIPIQQTGAKQLPKEIEMNYRGKLKEKADRNETLVLPRNPLDCWIGKKGKNMIPRVDIERYYDKGDMPHFQRFRFQRGSDDTYGGLRLPIQCTMTVKMILEAFEAWVKNGSAYLVVFNPKQYTDLVELHKLYEEIFDMDLDNRRQAKKGSVKSNHTKA